MTDIAKAIAGLIATEISARPEQVKAAVGLLDGGQRFPSSRAIARRLLEGSMTPSCARWRQG